MPLSLAKDAIEIALLEGIHPSAKTQFNQAGYPNVHCISLAPDTDELNDMLAKTHIVGIRSRTQITQALLDAMPNLMAIGCFCIGTNQVETHHAAKLGIPVFNSPFSNTRSVAELVLAEAIMLLRKIPYSSTAAHQGHWQKSAAGCHEARGKTLGIIGYGRIGSQLSVLAESLGMRVIFYDIENKLTLGNATAVPTLNALLSQADVVTLHVPQTKQTRKMIGPKELDKMKPDSHLINASRGEVVDIKALANALSTQQLAGAAIDVFPTEPGSNKELFTTPLQGLDNVILTPHIGGSTQEAQEQIGLDVAKKLIRYSDNGSTQSAVNFPEVSLPVQDQFCRLLHIHHSEPGVLEQINRIFSERQINITAQFLQTHGNIGYVVMDLDTNSEEAKALNSELRSIKSTVRTRLLYQEAGEIETSVLA